MAMFFVLFFAACLTGTWATNCPEVSGMQDFDYTKVHGSWIEHRRFPEEFNRDARCVFVTYLQNGESYFVSKEGYVTDESGIEKKVSESGMLKVTDPSQPAKFEISFFSNPRIKGNYAILDTDYKTYMITASYKELEDSCRQRAWILTKSRYDQPEVMEKALQSAAENGVDISQFEISHQEGC